VADDMQNAVPTDFNISPDINVSGRGGFSGLASGPLVVVQQMIVRGEEDIRRVSLTGIHLIFMVPLIPN